MPASPKPTTIGGVTYPSRKAAAEALGLDPRTIYSRVYRGNLEPANRLGVPVPLTVNGVHYPSFRQAAAAIGCSPTTISKLYARHGPTFSYTANPTPRPVRKPLVIDGQAYPSRAEAARRLGIPYLKLQRMYQE